MQNGWQSDLPHRPARPRRIDKPALTRYLVTMIDAPGPVTTPTAPATAAGPYIQDAPAPGTGDGPGGPKSRNIGILRRLIDLVRPHKARFALAVVTLLLASGLTLVYPWAAKEAIDAGMKSATSDKLDKIVLGLLALFLVNAVLVWLRHYSMSWLGERVVTDLRAMVFDRVLTLPLQWFHERRSGELVSRLASDVTVVESVVGSELSMALRYGEYRESVDIDDFKVITSLLLGTKRT